MEWLFFLRSKPRVITKDIKSLKVLDKEIIKCSACPRLTSWRKEVAITKRAAYRNEDYWGKPVTGFGPSNSKLLIVGLAPGAHGANRTGRVFTGDSSGDWLYRSLHKNGLAKISTSLSSDDGQELFETRITCALRCAPPTLRVFLPLGQIAWKATIDALLAIGEELPRKRPKFGHGASFNFLGRDGNTRLVIGSYHPSQQNTFTGKLTRSQLDSVVKKAGRFAHAEVAPVAQRQRQTT
jgi:uracil-DNA glycosylase